jgi:hypothetical protein
LQPVSRDNYQRAEIISGLRSGVAPNRCLHTQWDHFDLFELRGVAIRVAPNRCLHRLAEKLSKAALLIARWQGFGKGSYHFPPLLTRFCRQSRPI